MLAGLFGVCREVAKSASRGAFKYPYKSAKFASVNLFKKSDNYRKNGIFVVYLQKDYPKVNEYGTGT